MVEKMINNIEIKIMSDWSEIPFRIWIDNERLKNNCTDLNDEYLFALYNLLKLNEVDVLDINYGAFLTIMSEVLIGLSTNVDEKFVNQGFEHKGKTYKTLDNFDNITTREMLDVKEILSQGEILDTINSVLAVIIRETDNDGNIKPYNRDEMQQRALTILEMPTIQVMKIIDLFFYSLKT